MINNKINSIKKGGGQIYGFDTLKFFMATMIVAIHTQAFNDVDTVRQLTAPLLAAAVPVFFILSSYFLFRKMDTRGYKWEVYVPFLKRLLILYIFWFIVTLPFTLHEKWYYLDYNFPKICCRILTDFLFSYTFRGSWFMSALIVGSLIVFLLKKYLNVADVVLFVLATITYVYMKCYYVMPAVMQEPILFIQNHIREEVEQTPLNGFIWCSIGCLLAKDGLMEDLSNKLEKKGCLMCLIIAYLVLIFFPTEYQYLIVPLFVISIVLSAYKLELKPNGVYIKLRNLSILIYFIHFPLLSVVGRFLPVERLHIVDYLSVLITSLTLAVLILKFEKWKCFKFLKYCH